MGRGLSDLQRFILRRALATRDGPRRPPAPYWGDIEVCAVHVLDGYYRWPRTTWYSDERRQITILSARRKYERAAIGPRRYNAAMVALSKAFTRLMTRGLLVHRDGNGHHPAGYVLTDEGERVARSLSANSLSSCEGVSRYIEPAYREVTDP
jgi:hypothetical protein